MHCVFHAALRIRIDILHLSLVLCIKVHFLSKKFKIGNCYLMWEWIIFIHRRLSCGVGPTTSYCCRCQQRAHYFAVGSIDVPMCLQVYSLEPFIQSCIGLHCYAR